MVLHYIYLGAVSRSESPTYAVRYCTIMYVSKDDMTFNVRSKTVR